MALSEALRKLCCSLWLTFPGAVRPWKKPVKKRQNPDTLTPQLLGSRANALV